MIFGRFAKIPSGGFPYPVFVFAGLMPWTLFSPGHAGVGPEPGQPAAPADQGLLPPAVRAGRVRRRSSWSTWLISLGLYAPVLLYYGVVPSWRVVLPPLVLLTFVATLGMGVTLAALTVLYRDFRTSSRS